MESNYSRSLRILKYALMIICVFFAHSQVLSAKTDLLQQRTVKGTVIDETGLPLIGVTVMVKGNTTGTITDIDGNYTIPVSDSKAVLQFTFIGFQTHDATVGDQTVINLVLKEDLQKLDEVVVVGYGVQKKSHLTGSITKVRTEGLEDIPVSRVDQALQGRVAGVQVQNLTSEVGAAPQIRVRGMGSINANDGPLIIIDGFPVDEGLGVVNMNDVESIEVLKDAASSAIYGSRAANGVIMVTTKSGSIDKPKYSLKTSWGIKNAYKLHDIMSSKEYIDMRVNEVNLLGQTLPANEFAFTCIDNDLDWQKEGTRTANMYNVQLGISGGKKGLKYYVSGSYIKDEGIMLDNEYEKINLRSKIDATLSKRVTMGINLAPTYSKRKTPSTNFIDFYRTPSWLPVRHTAQTAKLTGYPEGSYANGAHFNNVDYVGKDPQTGEERSVKASPFNTANHNPRMILDNEKIKREEFRLQTSAFMNVNIIKGLDFKTSNSFDISYRDDDRYRNKDAKKDGETNRGLYQNRLITNLLTENTLNYITKIDKKHDINGLLGFSAQRIRTKTAGILGVDFPNDMVETLNQAGNILIYEGDDRYTGTWIESEAMVSAYGRLTYSYDDRYLLSASIRTDGSSKFGVDNRWGWFPSASLGWRLSEEKFIKDNVDWINQLKLRTSYGVTGTDKIVNFANTDLLQSANYILGPGNGSVTSGLANNSIVLGNRQLKWEQTNEYNVGLDLSVLDNRIGLIVDYYYSKTKSLLFERSINSVSGYQRNWTNLGKIRNKGIEIELTGYIVQDKHFKWNASANFSANKNKVLDLGGPHQLIAQGERNEMYVTQVGGPAVQFWGYKTVGVWNSQEEINNNPHHEKDQPGGLRLQNTNNDGVINDLDMVPLGSPFPDFTWGITNNFKYKGFDLSVLIQGVEGIDVWNGDEFYNETRKWNKKYVTNRWLSPEHPGDGKTPYFNNGIDHMMTDYAIQDGSYIALRDITLGYTAPAKYVKKLGLSSLRIYTSIQNLGYWWTGDYKGINPEARITSGLYNHPLVSGYQRGSFPLSRTFSFGIDFNF